MKNMCIYYSYPFKSISKLRPETSMSNNKLLNLVVALGVMVILSTWCFSFQFKELFIHSLTKNIYWTSTICETMEWMI